IANTPTMFLIHSPSKPLVICRRVAGLRRSKPRHDLNRPALMQTIEHKQRNKVGMPDIVRVMLLTKKADCITAFQKEYFADLVQVVSKMESLYPVSKLIPEDSTGQKLASNLTAYLCLFCQKHQGFVQNAVQTCKEGYYFLSRCSGGLEHVSYSMAHNVIPNIK